MTPRELANRLNDVEIAADVYSARCPVPVGMHAPSRLHFSANGTDHINLRCDDPTCNHALIADALGVSVEQLLAVPVSAASDNHAEAGGAAPHLAAEDIENAAVEALL